MPKTSYSGVIRVFKLLFHAGLVLFVAGFPALLYFETKKNVVPHGNPLASPYYWLVVLPFLAFFYGYTYYLIPRFFLKKRYGAFLASMLLVYAMFHLVKPVELFFANVLLPLQGLKPGKIDILALDFVSLVIFITLAMVGLAIQIVRQWRLSERRALQAETDKANAELSFLKAQIHPHFLFNTLNSIYALILTQNPLAGDAVLKLGNIMRFVTDDAASDFVPLEREVAFITDYINLQRLQHGKKVQLDFTVTGSVENKQIAPLILLTYIENAFKYGISNHEAAPIIINLEASPDQLVFYCRNRIFAKPRVAERTGIGLRNTQKRLEHLYPKRHDLSIARDAEFYTVTLRLPALP